MKSRFFVFFSFALALGVVGYYAGGSFVRRFLRESERPESTSISVQRVEPVVEPVKQVTSYQLGYDRGYRAYLEQQGIAVPVVPAVRYVVEEELDSEQASKGYVDGYHRAGDSLHCPRSEYGGR